MSQLIALRAGVHHVSDVYCVSCGGYMGWQYVDAEDADQKYKIGKGACVALAAAAFRNHSRNDALTTPLLTFCRPGKSVLEMAKLEKVTRESNAPGEPQL